MYLRISSKEPYECFCVFRIISCVFVYLDSIKVSHSFYDAKIVITSIAYIRLSSKCCIFIVQSFSQIQCKHSALVVTRVIQKKVRPNFGHTNITSPIIEY